MIRLCLPKVAVDFLRYTTPVPAGLGPSVEECLASGTLLLERAGIGTPRLDAECLLAHVMGCARWRLVLEPSRRLIPEEFGRYLTLLQRRELREPLAYLLGTREFWSLPLAVSPGVLIPRPETETLVEAALATRREMSSAQDAGVSVPAGLTIVELCTGTGAVAIALARELPRATIFATDVSRRALRVARANAETHGVAERVTFLRGDLWAALDGRAPVDRVDLILGNPPYIPSGAIPMLMPEVRWEPRRALDGGPDGLRFYREIIPAAPQHLRPGGHLLLEIGEDQATAVRQLLQAVQSFEECRVLQDLAGRDRVIVAQRRRI